MVGVPATVIPYCPTDVLRHTIQVGNHRVDAALGKFGAFDCRIQLGHIARMMLSMVDFHGTSIDMGF